jgi:hypothetical protein
LLLWEVRVGRWWPSNMLAWVSAALALMALLGYALGVGPVIELAAHQHISLSSTVALAVLSLGCCLGARIEERWRCWPATGRAG